MKARTLSLTTILGFLGLILMIHTMSSYASSSDITCTTAFGEKTFTISGNNITFQKEDDSGVSRSISSTNKESVRTQVKHLGFTKTLYIDGQKHRINIRNSNEFSEINDSLSITSSRGHEMTYPLSCHSV